MATTTTATTTALYEDDMCCGGLLYVDDDRCGEHVLRFGGIHTFFVQTGLRGNLELKRR
jgi:hypothetical protein